MELLINLLRKLALEDSASYINVLRMDEVTFEELLALISPAIKKQDTIMRLSISCKTKLEITLRFLASGDSFCSLGLLFGVPHNTISVFLPHVLAAIYEALAPYFTVRRCLFSFTSTKVILALAKLELRVLVSKPDYKVFLYWPSIVNFICCSI